MSHDCTVKINFSYKINGYQKIRNHQLVMRHIFVKSDLSDSIFIHSDFWCMDNFGISSIDSLPFLVLESVCHHLPSFHYMK